MSWKSAMGCTKAWKMLIVMEECKRGVILLKVTISPFGAFFYFA